MPWASCQQASDKPAAVALGAIAETAMQQQELELATLGAGCFWCVEAVYQEVDGIVSVESGYAGGHVKNPSYREVCAGTTGHAEVARIAFDPKKITFEQVLEVFWHTHDPTTLNRQGNDVGTQYRSSIFYHSEAQRQAAEASKAKTDASGLWPKPIVTEIVPLSNYYKAEDYHQNYYRQNSSQPYCSLVIAPKLAKFRKEFKHLLKKDGASAH
jgi:peptide-methionine (S)-S-oxide reductase